MPCTSDAYGCNGESASVWQQDTGYQTLVAMGTVSVLTGVILGHVGAGVRVIVPDARAYTAVLGADRRDWVDAVVRRTMRMVDAVVAGFLAFGSLLVAAALASPLRQGGETSRPFVDYTGGVAFAFLAFGAALAALGAAVRAALVPRACCTGAGLHFVLVSIFRILWILCVWTFAAQINPDFGHTLGTVLMVYAFGTPLVMFWLTRAKRAAYTVSNYVTVPVQEAIASMHKQAEAYTRTNGALDTVPEEMTLVVPTGPIARAFSSIRDARDARNSAATELRRSLRVLLWTAVASVADVAFFTIPGTVVFVRVPCTWGQ